MFLGEFRKASFRSVSGLLMQVLGWLQVEELATVFQALAPRRLANSITLCFDFEASGPRKP